MRRVFSLPLIFVLFLTSVLAQNNTPAATAFDTKELTGEYIWSTGFVGASYELRGDGSFEYRTSSDCCDPVWRETGSYSVKDNVLHLKVITKTLNKYNMLDPNQAVEAYRKVYNRPDAEVPADKMHTEYDLQVVRWGERIYLLNEANLPRFVAAVNFNIEPRQHILVMEDSYVILGVFLRRGDEKKAAAGKPSLPEPWLSSLDNPPIYATITNVKDQNNERIYTMNKGSANGLKVGMILFGEGDKPDQNSLTVTAVAEGSATAKHSQYYSWTKNYQIGNTFYTKPYKNLR